MKTRQYWLRYQPWFGQQVVDEVEETVREVDLDSAGVRIHLDLYTAPRTATVLGTVVLTHGLAGYGRLLAPFALGLRARGFHVICPDLMGYGFYDGARGDWTWEHLIQNLLDTLDYAAGRFDGPLFLAGASMGGPLAYHAACRRRDLAGLATYCLFDYRDSEFLREVSGAGWLLRGALLAGATLAPHLRIPAGWVARYRDLAEDPRFVATLRADPCAGNRISLQAVASMVEAVPDIEYDRFQLPTLVLHPEQDRMISPRWSRSLFGRLGCRKRYVEIPGCGHWAIRPDQVELAVGEMAGWFGALSREMTVAI